MSHGRYEPGPVPFNPKQLPEYVQRELRRLGSHVEVALEDYAQTGGNQTISASWTFVLAGPLKIGVAATETITGNIPSLQVNGAAAFGLFARYNNAGGGPNLCLVHSRHATVGSHTILASGDELGALSFGGSNGSAFEYNKARIVAYVDGTPGASSDFPTRLSYFVTPDGSTTVVEVARMDRNTTAGETRFMLYDVDNGTLERVSVGAADSGGVGFKVLRIPN